MDHSYKGTAEQFGKTSLIDEGIDSKVYKITAREFIAKKYDNLVEKVGLDKARNIIEKYFADTQRAHDFLLKNPNPLNQTFDVGDKKYQIQYEVIPQGPLILGKNLGEVTVVGQGLVRGNSLLTLLNSDSLDVKTSQKLFAGVTPAVNLKELIKQLNVYLNQNLNSDFNITMMGSIPTLQPSKKIVRILIVDLAESLEEYYDRTKKLENPFST